MPTSSIPVKKTPSRPIGIGFAGNFTTPSDIKKVMIIGHFDDNTPSGTLPYIEFEITNIASVASVTAEVTTKFGATCEASLMVIAAVTANVGNSNFPLISVVGLDELDTDIPLAARTVLDRAKFDFLVSPYDAIDDDSRAQLLSIVQAVSGSDRTDMGQFGAFGVMFNRSVTDFTTLPTPDTQYLFLIIMRDTSTGLDAPPLSIAEMAAGAAAKRASGLFPYFSMDKTSINGFLPPVNKADYITYSTTGDSEVILSKGWTPLYVQDSGLVAFVRDNTSRITDNGSALNPQPGEPYVDVQDFLVLYFLRKTLWTRFSRKDFLNQKGNDDFALRAKGEITKILIDFQAGSAIQAVDLLLPYLVVKRNPQDRTRYDVFLDVNVTPAVHTIATEIRATTEGDIDPLITI